MGHDISLLPEALPDDAEDVAWGLQTATALWNRGELKEALVWLRRAAESATSAGQEARGTTLSKSAADLEQWMTPPVRPVDPLAQTGPAPASGTIPPPKPPPPRQAVIELEPELLEEETNDMRELPSAAAAAAAAVFSVQPATSFESVPSPALADAQPKASVSFGPKDPPSSTANASPSRPPSQALASVAPAAVSTSAGPSNAEPIADGVHGAVGVRSDATKAGSKLGGLAEDPPRKDVATPTPAQVVAASKPASGIAIHEAQTDDDRAPAAQKKRSRAPILDPWSDDLPASDAPRTVHHRTDTQGPDDSDVMTSAPPLDVTLKRKPPPPPPKRSGTFPGASGTTLATVPESPESKRTSEVQLPPPPASTDQPAAVASSQPTTPSAPSIQPAPSAPMNTSAPSAQPAPSVPAASVQQATPSVPAASDMPPQTSGARPPPPRRPTIQPRAASAAASEDRKSVPPQPPLARDERDAPPPTMPAAQRKPTMQPRVPPPPPPMRAATGETSAPPARTPTSEMNAPTSQRASSPSVAPSAPQPAPVTAPSPEHSLASTLVTDPAPIAKEEPVAAGEPQSRGPGTKRASIPPPVASARRTSAPPPPSGEASSAAPTQATASPSARPPAPAANAVTTDEPTAIVMASLTLSSVEGFEDLPTPALAALRDAATMIDLGAEEEASSTGALLVVEGSAVVCATVSDAAARHLAAGNIASSIATRSDATRTRVVAITSAKVAVWDRAALEEILKSAPGALEELGRSADRLAAFAGSTMGPLGDLDEGSRMAAFERMTTKTLKPGESFVAAGSELPGLTVVGSGALVLTDGREFETGDVVLPEFALEGGELPWDITAGNDGAIVLSANRMGTVELFSVLPSLLELLRIV